MECCVRLLCGVLCQIVARKCFSYGAQSSIFANKFLYGLVCFIVFAVSSVRAVVRNPCLDISKIWCQKLFFLSFDFLFFYFFKIVLLFSVVLLLFCLLIWTSATQRQKMHTDNQQHDGILIKSRLCISTFF